MGITRMAVVGCGEIARETALVCRFNRKIKLVACVDTNLEKAAQFARKHKIEDFYDDYDTMLSKSTLDVVYLAVPHYLHFQMIVTAVERGLHVFCEKPATSRLEDALQLCSQLRKSDSKVGINYQYRYDKACYAICRAAQKGELGELYYIQCNVPWYRESDYFSQAKWHASLEQSGGGTLLTQASHIVDMAMWAMQSQPKYVQGLKKQMKFTDIEVEDFFTGTIELENSSLIQVTSSMVVNPERCITMNVQGSKGTGQYQGSFFPKSKFKGIKLKKEKPPVGGLHAFVASIEAYRRWVAADETYLMPIQNSLAVLSVIEALYKSADSGKSEMVDDRYLEFTT